MMAALDPRLLFEDGFESGDARAWDGNLGHPSYSSAVELRPPGQMSCGGMTLIGGVAQASPYWSKAITYTGDVLYVSQWRLFPAGYSWSGTPAENARNNLHHKMVILDTADNVGRFHLNLSAAGPSDVLSPQFRPEFESLTGPTPNGWLPKRWPTDGQWHRLEIEITRIPGSGRLRLWLDGELFLDKPGTTCGAVRSPIVRAKIGAYVNQGAADTETFWVGKVKLYAGTREQALAAELPPPPPPPPTRRQRLTAALEALGIARTELDALLAMEDT